MDISALAAIIPTDFPNNSRIWIYQSSRPFTEKENIEIDEQLYQFYSQWLSHQQQVHGWAKVLFHRFVVVMADETLVDLGGCSIDSSMKIIKSLERQYQLTLLDRLSLIFWVKNKTETLPLNQLQYAIDNGFIQKDTLFFNNMVATKQELLEKWLVPVQESWLARKLVFPVDKESI